MMRSLWAGVSGLQAHQIAMDTEGNNIANVNTAGFKYSRVNFADMLSQTGKIATAPQGSLGGKNPMQVGLGTQVSSVTKIFKQGSVQTTDKNTDLAIQGDGFFVISPDGGSTYKYTRNGDFNFDALGNFTDSNGYIIQGWLKDESTGEIDATTPIANITIPPGLTTPANESSYITLKANLNSGDTITSKSAISTLDSQGGWYDANNDGTMNANEKHDENDLALDQFDADGKLIERGMDMASLFNDSGEAFNIKEGQGVWMSYATAQTQTQTIIQTQGQNVNWNFTVNGVLIKEDTWGAPSTGNGLTQSDVNNQTTSHIAQLINAKTSQTGVKAKIEGGNRLILVNENNSSSDVATKNIDFKNNSVNGPKGLESANVITAFAYTYASTATSATSRTDLRKFTTTEDLRAAMQKDAKLYTDYLGNGFDTTSEELANVNDGVKITVNDAGQFQISNPKGDAFNGNDGDQWDNTINPKKTISAAENNNYLYSGISLPVGNDGLPLSVSGSTGPAPGKDFIYLSKDITFKDSDGTNITVTKGVKDIGDTASNAYKLSAEYAASLPNPGLTDTIEIPAGSVLNLTAFDPATDIPGAGVNSGPIHIEGAAADTWSITTDATGVAGTDDVSIIGPITLDAGKTFDIPLNVVAYQGGNLIDTSSGPVTIGSATSTETQIFDININLKGGGEAITLPSGTVIAGGFTPQSATGPTINEDADNDGNSTNTYYEDVSKAMDINLNTNYTSTDDHDLFIASTGYSFADPDNPIGENSRFNITMGALQGALTTGESTRTSQNIYAASHASSIDVYDSLGSKHTVRLEFTKQTSNEWAIKISVPEPGVLNAGFNPENIITGSIRFNSDGSLAGSTPTSLTYTANNGSTPNQNIALDLGTLGQFDGMTSYDAKSDTSGISQDGYSGGDLDGVRVDETGTLIGSFTNGRSFGLAQVSMAKFSNNSGLESDGGNAFIQTSNSGEPIIGQAALGGRGFIQASALEMSNVDLSRSLTQLIVIQRGFQANSKTITTSDQMLNTLLQLKQ